MLDCFKLQFRYDLWAFTQLFESLKTEEPSKEIVQQLSHVTLAQEAWLSALNMIIFYREQAKYISDVPYKKSYEREPF